MQADAKSPVGEVGARHSSTTWAEIKIALKHNDELGEMVLWCLGLDWQRTKPRFQGFALPDRIFQTALTWEWWAVVQYRFSYWVHHRALPDLPGRSFIRKFCFLQQAVLLRLCYLTGRIVEGLSGARLSPMAEIGPGLHLTHTGSCGIGVGVRVGSNFTLYQDANIVSGRDGGCAEIGDNVILYSGARVIGGVRIGDNTRVGANAVVTRDLPAGCLAIGAPAAPVGSGVPDVSYAALFMVRDLANTLVLAGRLEELGDGLYRDRETGGLVTIRSAGGEEESVTVLTPEH